ncbi:hypothetical protein [Iningainema tapete]|uniref:Uncharacterized protein n=1 Tax=Iningainema tapete BLCC-T55 TaxID=2748662 RepID=A0A8J6XBZ8_9CYAN|nr:hypothetical protein [Iningainema tapete]MBD2772059.1 hypothetical protein [Iningainema tapete BLCC-T55]
MATSPMLAARVPPEWAEKVKAIAKQTNRTEAEVLRQALQEFLERRGELTAEAATPVPFDTNLVSKDDLQALEQRFDERFGTLIKMFQQLQQQVDKLSAPPAPVPQSPVKLAEEQHLKQRLNDQGIALMGEICLRDDQLAQQFQEVQQQFGVLASVIANLESRFDELPLPFSDTPESKQIQQDVTDTPYWQQRFTEFLDETTETDFWNWYERGEDDE